MSQSTDAVVPQERKHSVAALIAGWAGIAAQLAVLVLYAFSGLMAPAWAVIGLLVIGLALLGVAVYLLRTRPAWALAVPVAALIFWFAVMSAGDAWLGWTA